MGRSTGSEVAFYVLDRNLRLISATPNTLSIWGKSRREVVGKKLTDLFPYVEGGPVHEALIQAAQTFRPVSLRVPSVVLGKPVDVEIYPLGDELQVRFAPSKQDVATAAS
jgi:hypothetical protein